MNPAFCLIKPARVQLILIGVLFLKAQKLKKYGVFYTNAPITLDIRGFARRASEFADQMTWWVSLSMYVRNPDDLRLLAELFRIHLGSIVGSQIYPVVDVNPKNIRSPYTIDHNRRPAIVAIYISLIDPKAAPKEHPMSAMLAEAIAERKSADPRLADASSSLVHMLSVLTREWYRYKKHNIRINLDAKTRVRIQLFAETLTRAGQLYRETLEKNRIIWDSSAPGYTGETAAKEFNFAFDIFYIELAISELKTRNTPICDRTAEYQDDAEFADLPDLIYDTKAEVTGIVVRGSI